MIVLDNLPSYSTRLQRRAQSTRYHRPGTPAVDRRPSAGTITGYKWQRLHSPAHMPRDGHRLITPYALIRGGFGASEEHDMSRLRQYVHGPDRSVGGGGSRGS